jgi:hypothetical protein
MVTCLTFDLLELSDLRDLMEKHGFREASGIIENPIVPGSDGFDTYWYRDSDRVLVLVFWTGGEVDPPAEYKVAYGKWPSNNPDRTFPFQTGYLTLSMVKEILRAIL